MKIKKGDKVQVLAGKDKGKTGKILEVYPERGRVSVEGINLRYKNMRPRRQGEKGQRIQFPAAMDVSNVALLSPVDGKPTRVGYKVQECGRKVRICRRTETVIDK